MTGRNSGIRSIGDSTQSPANATAIFADRGTRGSLRKRRTVVAQAGSTDARSLADPGGSLLASAIISPHDPTITATPINATRRSSTPPRYGRSIEQTAQAATPTNEGRVLFLGGHDGVPNIAVMTGRASAGARTSSATPRVSTVIANSRNWQSCSAATRSISCDVDQYPPHKGKPSSRLQGQEAPHQQQSSPFHASRPSRTARKAIPSAAIGSAHHQPNVASSSSPASSTIER